MNFVLQPWQLLLAILAGWSNRQQHDVIECLRTENQILKEQLAKRRIVLYDDRHRRHLALLLPTRRFAAFLYGDRSRSGAYVAGWWSRGD